MDYDFLKAYAEYRVTGVLRLPKTTSLYGLPGALKRIFVYPLLRRLWPRKTANPRPKPSGDDGWEMVCPNCENRVTVFLSAEEYECMLDDGGYPCTVSRFCNELMRPVEENDNA